MEIDLYPTGPLYLEIGNGIQPVIERLSQKTKSRAAATNNNRENAAAPPVHNTIDSVVLRGRYCRFIDTDVSHEEINDVLMMASCLPHLKRLSLRRLQIPIAAITKALTPQDTDVGRRSSSSNTNHNSGLQELELRSICLSGTLKEMEDLAQALSQHSTLIKISLADCRPEGGSCHVLDPLLVALARMPSLKTVELDLMEITRWLQSEESFSKLFHGSNSNNLRTITLSYMRVPEETIAAMAMALQTNTTLEELYLDRCDSLSRQSTLYMAQMLQHNTSLKKIKMVVKDYEDAIPIAVVLQKYNSTLKSLFLRSYHQQVTVSPRVYQAFLTMLQNNYSLEDLYTFQGNPMTQEKTDSTLNFYLKLNRAGRGRLMNHRSTRNDDTIDMEEDEQQVSNDEWVKSIIKSRADVECSFYFLSQNPSVCGCSLDR
jgi:hypothetical protein